jgi:glycosyltransferase involved in cell wall biosynthesis
MKKILFIDNQQFGYLTDSYKYCEILRREYEITYLCFDKGFKKIELDGIKLKYISYSGNKTVRGIRFIFKAIVEAAFFNGFIFVIYFEKFNLIKRLLPWKKMHIDIRTLCVARDEKKREKKDNNIKRAVKLFDTASAISQGVIDKIGLNKNIYLLPLGADVISRSNKTFNNLRLLYVGTLYNRDIIKTVIGFKKYIDLYPDIDIKYTVVGDGEEYEDILKYISEEKLDELITCKGRVPHDQLGQYFDNCNIGVSFVPITDYYENQPPTKTFEYAFSGMFTIATGTGANREIINSQNGYIINDSPESFVEALEYIQTNRQLFDSDVIRESVKDYSWQNIVNRFLIPIIEKRVHVN